MTKQKGTSFTLIFNFKLQCNRPRFQYGFLGQQQYSRQFIETRTHFLLYFNTMKTNEKGNTGKFTVSTMQ